MLTVLAAAQGPWLAQEPAATVIRFAFPIAGPLYVVLGALSALVFLWGALGWRPAISLAATAIVLSLGAEVAGTATGLPFGDYAYTPLLGYRLFGRVPFPIPLSWFYMLIGSVVVVARLVPARDNGRGRWLWALLAALLMVAWDIAMDPSMVKTSHWVWGSGTSFREADIPAWIVAFFTRDVFYGMPLSNWFGWLLTATLVARLMLAVTAPSIVASRLAPSALPIALYLVNGIMPVALCVRDRFWWAAALGTAAMAAPGLVAWSRAVPRPAPGSFREQPA